MRLFLILNVLMLIVLVGCELPVSFDTILKPDVDVQNQSATQDLSQITLELSPPSSETGEPSVTIPPSLTPSEEITPALPEIVPSATQEIPLEFLYHVQAGTPIWIPNFSHPEVGCNFLGVAGQVFDSDDLAVNNLVVEVNGTIDGVEVNQITLTGVAPSYGPGGYELKLADRAIDSDDSLWLQIYDLTGQTLSPAVSFDTFADCNRNLTLVNFVQTGTQIIFLDYFFPFTYHNSLLQSVTLTPQP